MPKKNGTKENGANSKNNGLGPVAREKYESILHARVQKCIAAQEAKVATQMGNQGMAFEGNRLINEWIADGAQEAVAKAKPGQMHPTKAALLKTAEHGRLRGEQRLLFPPVGS